ncbi:bola-like protein [Rhizophagus irregularis DAOM 181602=DAOM 197198]|nr:bola-like protein [Rhizophagus irregularis DAOM 181602=DAOM 197198]
MISLSIFSKSIRTKFIHNLRAMTEVGPIYQSIQQKLTKAFNPTSLEIINESHLHAHHQAMKDVTSKETHFCISIVSDHFEGKKLIQRHRLIYELLNEEMNMIDLIKNLIGFTSTKLRDKIIHLNRLYGSSPQLSYSRQQIYKIMEGLLSDLDKLNVKTEDELFIDQFSKLSAGNSNINKPTENQSFPYATHKMFGNDILPSTTTTTTKSVEDILYSTKSLKSFNTSAVGNEINDNNDNEIGWFQTPKVNEEDEGWGDLPDVNTSVDSNRRFGMNSILSDENLNLTRANVNQKYIFGSEYISNNNNLQFGFRTTNSETNRGFPTAAENNFRSINK